MKEKPFLDAASRLGPLPDFLFSNPVVAGFITALLSAFFGAFTATFMILLYGSGHAAELFDFARGGAIVATVFSTFIFFLLYRQAQSSGEEKRDRLLFVLGGALGICALVALDLTVSDDIRAWLEPLGRVT